MKSAIDEIITMLKDRIVMYSDSGLDSDICTEKELNVILSRVIKLKVKSETKIQK